MPQGDDDTGVVAEVEELHTNPRKHSKGDDGGEGTSSSFDYEAASSFPIDDDRPAAPRESGTAVAMTWKTRWIPISSESGVAFQISSYYCAHDHDDGG